MALNTVTTGNTILAADVNQLVQVLQRAAGQTEVGKYHLLFASYVSGAQGQVYIPTLSRTTTPVSVTIDTADQAPSSCAAPSTAALTSAGFQIYSTSTAITIGCNAGGNYTVQY